MLGDVVALLLLPVLLLSVEIEAYVDVEVVDGITQADSVASVVVQMADKGSACKPVCVVPNDTGTRYEVEIEVLDVAPELFAAEAFAFHLLDADARCQRYGEEEVACEDPIISIASAGTHVEVVEFGNLHLVDQRCFCPRLVAGEDMWQLGVVEHGALLVKPESENPRTATLALHCALGEAGRV